MEIIDKKFIDDLKEFFSSVQKYAGSTKCIFLSKRFLDIYNYLTHECSEIILPNISLINDPLDKKSKKIYINDINYDFPKRIKLINKENETIVYKFCATRFLPYRDVPMVTRKDIKIDSKKRKKFCENNMRNLRNYHIRFRHKVGKVDILQTLGLELKMLQDSGAADPIGLLPDFLQNYFHFITTNQEYLSYFLDAFYMQRNESYAIENHYPVLTRTLVDDMIQIYGKENLSPELLQFLMKNQKWGHTALLHYPLNQGSKMFEDCFPIYEDGKIKRREYRKEEP